MKLFTISGLGHRGASFVQSEETRECLCFVNVPTGVCVKLPFKFTFLFGEMFMCGGCDW